MRERIAEIVEETSVWNTLDELAIEVNQRTGMTRLLPELQLERHPTLQSVRSNAILMYHSVGDPAQYGNVSVKRFRRDLRFLTEEYRVVDLPDILDLSGGSRVALTFDDGLRNFYESVVPLLHEFGVPATVFVSTGLIASKDGQLTKSSRVADLYAEEDVMTEAQIEHLVEDEHVHIGNHAHSHCSLPTTTNHEELRREILEAKAELENRFGIEVTRFCYPFGDYDRSVIEVVSDSHELAVTTRSSVVCDGSDRYRLPRIAAHAPERLSRCDWTHLHWQMCELIETGLGQTRSARI